jgi:acyl-CoA reductase-like NAD-dependent aldehyde dehydrogenase
MMELPYPAGLPIGDRWIPAPSTEPVHFPYDGSVVAEAPVGDASLAGQALDLAVAARSSVGRMPSHVRRAALQSTYDAVAAQRDAFVDLLVLETGKPLVDCRVEVERTLLTLQASAEEVARLHGETVPLDLLPSGDGLLGFWVRKPIGVVVGIAGFNYPLLLASHKVAPALAAGCPVIVKPAPQTPLATLWLVHLVRQALAAAGGSPSAVQLVTGGVDVGSTLTTDRRIGAVSFTGSAAVGHQIARDAAPTKVLLELGSNSALVVAADADLDAAADAVIRGGYYASGQACISVQRLIVVESVRGVLLDKLTARIDQVVVGDPRDEKTKVSALIDDRSTARVQGWIDQAVTAGATVAYQAAGTSIAAGATVDGQAAGTSIAGGATVDGSRLAPRCRPMRRRAPGSSARPCWSTCPTDSWSGTRRSSARSSRSARCRISRRPSGQSTNPDTGSRQASSPLRWRPPSPRSTNWKSGESS